MTSGSKSSPKRQHIRNSKEAVCIVALVPEDDAPVKAERRISRRLVMLVVKRDLPAAALRPLHKVGGRAAAGVAEPGLAAGREHFLAGAQQWIDIRPVVGDVRRYDPPKMLLVRLPPVEHHAPHSSETVAHGVFYRQMDS